MVDNNDRTIREEGDFSQTIRETPARKEKDVINLDHDRINITEFRGMAILRQFKTHGSEADIYLVNDNRKEKVLKLYRLGIEPRQDIQERYRQISEQCPEHVVKVFETGYDENTRRCYELLEFIIYGSVADALANRRKFKFQDFARQLGGAVNALHSRGIIHRDLKPGNILVREQEPLELVLTDFGVSSTLDNNISMRETLHKGFTPMYAAPEDMMGQVVSRASDWWACGMIFYEILTGSHPFTGLSANRITYFLSTQGVEIDNSLPDREKLLLKGLLTRNDKKRWGWQEVEAWLDGENSIPCFYEEAASADEANIPYILKGQKYYNLHDLALVFASNFINWNAARGSLARGNVAKWLQNRNMFDEERIVSEELANDNADIFVFNFIRRYAPELPLNLFGIELTSRNLLAILQLDKKKRTRGEEELIDIFLQGKFKSFFDFNSAKVNSDPVLENAANFKWDNEQALLQTLAASLEPDKFYWGPYGPPQTVLEKASLSRSVPELLTMSYWREMKGPELVLPPDICKLFKDGSYAKAIGLINSRLKEQRLLFKKDLPGNRSDIFRGTNEDYSRELGKKNGLDAKSLRLIARIENQIKKNRLAASQFSDVPGLEKELNFLERYTLQIQTGKIIWQQDSGKKLQDIYKDLERLSMPVHKLMNQWYVYPLMITVWLVVLVLGCLLFYVIGEALAIWIKSDSSASFVSTVCTIIAILISIVGLLSGGTSGLIGGAVVGFIISFLFFFLLKSISPAMPFILSGIFGISSLGLFSIYCKRKKARLIEEKPGIIRRLNENLLSLTK